ncbi:membrane hypothetical protein [Candidatus Xenohaliotis californiensis]|uniref:Prepilin type IV endopeptidase peptidase domain-containing protein n=1 Tax=Candidatus Xenohaliotis californiensis TaxID=84677 RepID=A0ABM9N8W3_9RICK|nr:membrane hypothetical protein [Candidatus Xenohaliotis californiensis]
MYTPTLININIDTINVQNNFNASGALIFSICIMFVVFTLRNIFYNPENEDVLWGFCQKCASKVGFFASRCRKCGRNSFNIGIIFLMLLAPLTIIPIQYNYGMGYNSILLFILLSCIVAIIITDCSHYIIPDMVHVIIAIVGLLFVYFNHGSLYKSILSSMFCFGLGLLLFFYYYFFRKIEGLGFGDVKLMGVLGIFLNMPGIPVLFFMAGVLGLVSAVLWRFFGYGKFFPFGPSLIVSLFLCLLFPVHFNNIMQLILYG